ncbi:MAG: cysS [Candidatus Nomurabacteria bacterium]|nr:cysS [Candidatus Nomurabacteria bacterium]
MAQDIQIYNTKTKAIEKFVPITEGEVSIYSCGPTVYYYPHLGNMRPYVFADTLRRMFISAGYKVNHVINITDVGHLTGDNDGDADTGEDKMEKGSAREGKSAWDVAKFYMEDFFECLDLLNIPRAEYQFPRATDYIEEQINLIKLLEDKGFTYVISDGVYFDTSKFPKYAEFAHLDIEGLRSGARVEANEEKRNITDFALWKFSPKDQQRQMEWDSPWGKGFPGWHIECSAMSKKLLGPHFDIHTGGIDHIPVHHTNEIAQSECANGVKYVNYWMHVNFLNDKDGKMSKSKGDFLRLQSLQEIGISPLEYKYYLLTSHYRAQMDLDITAIHSAGTAYKKLWNFCVENITSDGEVNTKYKREFTDALYDDVGTPAAIAIMWNLTKDTDIKNEDKYRTIIEMSHILGLKLHMAVKEEVVLTDEVKKLLDERHAVREAKNWPEADRLRDKITELGFEVKDTDEGQEVKEIKRI